MTPLRASVASPLMSIPQDLAVLGEYMQLEGWELERIGKAWVVTRRQGRAVRVLAAFTVEELLTKIARAN